MDRRRFVPFGEGLEGRALLSLLGSGLYSTYKKGSAQNVPLTWYQKEERVNHLPYYLRQVESNRYLPRATVEKLQADLHNVMGHLYTPTESTVNNFDLALRNAYKTETVSTAEANVLNRTFGDVLIAAGATPTQTINLQSDMNQLIYVDTKSVNPSLLATNDYSLALQTALAVGRPIKAPESAVLHKNDGILLDGGLLGKTPDHTPTLVGIYNIGARAEQITDIQIVTANGNVLATGPINTTTNAYSIKITTPLSDGIYDLYTRAIDNGGHLSNLSYHYLKLKVVSPKRFAEVRTVTVTPPAGPHGLIQGS